MQVTIRKCDVCEAVMPDSHKNSIRSDNGRMTAVFTVYKYPKDPNKDIRTLHECHEHDVCAICFAKEFSNVLKTPIKEDK